MNKVLLANEAAEQLEKLPNREKEQVVQAIDELEKDPITTSFLLRRTDHGTDLRVMQAGSNRIIYSVGKDNDAIIVITVSKH